MDWQEELNKLDMQKCVAIGLGIAALYYVLAFDNGSGLENEIAQNKAALTAQNATLGKVRRALEDQKKFENEIQTITSNMKDFQKFFATPMPVQELSGKVAAFAEQSELVINNLKPLEKAPEFPNYPETVVEFDVEGNFHDIMNFISLLTDMNKAIDFNKMEFATVVGGDFPVIKLKTTLVVYGSKEASGAGSTKGASVQPAGGNNG